MSEDKKRLKTEDQRSKIKDQRPKTEDLRLKTSNVKDVRELEAKCQEYLNGWQRAKADYENLKKDSERRLGELTEYVQAGIILDILSVYDHFKLALNHLPKEQEKTDWAQGFNHIKRDFLEFFKQFNIEEIKTVKEEFNPEFHDAISQEESDEPEGQIIKEASPGYMMKDKVVRAAKVVVSKPIK